MQPVLHVSRMMEWLQLTLIASPTLPEVQTDQVPGRHHVEVVGVSLRRPSPISPMEAPRFGTQQRWNGSQTQLKLDLGSIKPTRLATTQKTPKTRLGGFWTTWGTLLDSTNSEEKVGRFDSATFLPLLHHFCILQQIIPVTLMVCLQIVLRWVRHWTLEIPASTNIHPMWSRKGRQVFAVFAPLQN